MNMMKYLAPHWKTPMQKRLEAIDYGRMSAIDRLLVRYYMGGNIPMLHGPAAKRQAMLLQGQMCQSALAQQADLRWLIDASAAQGAEFRYYPDQIGSFGMNPFGA